MCSLSSPGLKSEVSSFTLDVESQPRVYINAMEGLPVAIDRNVKVECHLLRFDVYIVRGGSWAAADDASYCTMMPADTDSEILKRAVKRLAKEYADVLADDPDTSVKKLGESLSWIAPDWFQNK